MSEFNSRSPKPPMGCATASVSNDPGNHRWRCIWHVLTLGLILTPSVQAADIEVLALFRDQVIVRIDGVQHKLKPGQATPDDVRLISSDATGAVFEFEGAQRRYPLGSRIRSSYKQAERTEVQVFRDAQGMFKTIGSINGLPIQFLVDTGATTIAISSVQARRLGIDYRVIGEPGQVITASRVEPVFRVRFDTVKVGGIQLRNVQGTVMEGSMPDIPLLGMSFLGRLEMHNNGQRLVLRQKH